MPGIPLNFAYFPSSSKPELSEQAAIISRAAESGWLTVAGIREWACSVLDGKDGPPYWLIELATAPEEGMAEVIQILHGQSAKLSLRQRLQTNVVGHASGVSLLPDTLRELFFAAILDRQGPLPQPDEPLVDALVAWDCQDDLDHIPAELNARFETIFQTYLADAHEVISILRLALVRTAEGTSERSMEKEDEHHKLRG